MPDDNELDSAEPAAPTSNTNPDATPSSLLTVVGIGASAGGLPALRSFFAAIPPDSGITFVVVVHLSPEHESVLAELIQSAAAILVTQVTAQVQMVPNHIYVIPPGKRLLVQDSSLMLADLEIPQGPRMQIDLFFRSLAEVQGDGAAIILSGTGSDGAVGIQAIKEHGGLILVQSPDEAEYDGMPRSAIATGLVDAVGPVAELAQRLVAAKQIRISYHLPDDPDALADESQHTLRYILAELHTRTGHDFSAYKRPSMLRRIGRRLQVTRQRSLTGYLHHLQRDDDEVHHLFRDLLIHVTQFFRDPAAWATLASSVIPALFADKASRNSVRMWVAGCATGEEAYSLAILLLEQAARVNFTGTIQVFASDVSLEAIEYARKGTYPAAIAADVAAERLARFFIDEGNHYQVCDEVRNVVLFAQHNLLEDPPFSSVDLVSCRNLLIYIQREAQVKICESFHYALRPDGYLFLGSAEAVEGITDLFALVQPRERIYQRQMDARRASVLPTVARHMRHQPRERQVPANRHLPSDQGETHQRHLEELGPPSMLVDAHYHVLYISLNAGRYLQVRGGALTAELLQLVRPELQTALRSALLRAAEEDKAVFTLPVPVHFEQVLHPVALWVRPVPGEARQWLIVFLEDEVSPVANLTTDPDAQHAALVGQLEAELLRSQRAQQATDENYETVVEELGAANEELRSLNEEYRSTLEELETGKEELQSLNEELQLVNQELRAKVEEVSRAHGDLQNLVLATSIATLFLDRQLRIMRFTPGAAELFNLLTTDLDRLITDLRSKVQYEQLESDVRKVLGDLTPLVREVQDITGRWFLVNVRPYRTLKDQIMGVVLTFTDVTASKELELERHASEARFRQVWETTSDAMVLSDAMGTVVAANPAYLALYGYSAAQVIGHSFAIIFPEEAREDALAQYQQIFASKTAPAAFESVVQRADGTMRVVETRISYLEEAGQRTAMLSAIRDITERKQAEAALQHLNETLEHEVQMRTSQIRRLVTQLTMSEQEERRRISAILHDDLQQRLYGLNVQLVILGGLLTREEQVEARQILDECKQALRELIDVTRNLSVDLSPPVLHNEGLAAALRWLATQMEQQHLLTVKLATEASLPPLDDDLRVLLFQFVRELLFNIVKHAGVASAVVTLAHIDGQLRIEVRDQGHGFDPDRQGHLNSQGLLRIMQRLQLIEGRMHIDSRPGRGTRITLYVPLHDASGG